MCFPGYWDQHHACHILVRHRNRLLDRGERVCLAAAVPWAGDVLVAQPPTTSAKPHLHPELPVGRVDHGCCNRFVFESPRQHRCVRSPACCRSRKSASPPPGGHRRRPLGFCVCAVVGAVCGSDHTGVGCADSSSVRLFIGTPGRQQVDAGDAVDAMRAGASRC